MNYELNHGYLKIAYFKAAATKSPRVTYFGVFVPQTLEKCMNSQSNFPRSVFLAKYVALCFLFQLKNATETQFRLLFVPN